MFSVSNEKQHCKVEKVKAAWLESWCHSHFQRFNLKFMRTYNKAQLRDSCFLVDKLSQRVKVKHMRAVYLAFYSELRKQK